MQQLEQFSVLIELQQLTGPTFPRSSRRNDNRESRGLQRAI